MSLRLIIAASSIALIAASAGTASVATARDRVGHSIRGHAKVGCDTTDPLRASSCDSPAHSRKTDVGVISDMSKERHLIVLEDGKQFHLPASFSFKNLKVGDQVSIAYYRSHNRLYATSVKAAG